MMFCAPSIHLLAESGYFGGYDYTITHFIRGLNDNPVVNALFTWITFTADTPFTVVIIAALYLGGYKKEALVFAAVFLVTYFVSTGLKYLIARPRPSDLGVTPRSKPAGVTPRSKSSFPSGHTANAFAFATMLSHYHRKVAPFLFAWAILIAFSRPFLGVHYFTDLPGGAAVGIIVSLIITRIATKYDVQITRFVERLPPHHRSKA